MKPPDTLAAPTELVALRQSERRFRDYAAAAADWYWEADDTGRFIEIAEEAREFGIDPARLIALDRLTEQDTDDDVDRRRDVLARRRPFRDLLCRYDWEGFTLVFMLHGVPVHDAAGVFRGYRGCARNMTLTRELAQATGAQGIDAQRTDTQWTGAQTTARPPNDARRPMVPGATPLVGTVAPVSSNTTLRRLDILVVEDDAVNRLVINGYLSPHGHTVTFAHDGEQGVAQARARRHDVVLMDVMMPGMDGPAATRLIRALPPPLGDMPIIALTANAMQGDRERYLAVGMTDYVTKPIDRVALFAAIERGVGARAFGAVAAKPPADLVPGAKQAAPPDKLTNALEV